MESQGMHKNHVRITDHLHLLTGAVNTGVLLYKNQALLFDCCASVDQKRLAEMGVDRVEMICATQYRRVNMAGAYGFSGNGAKVIAPAAEQHLFDNVEAYWRNWNNRWHPYHARPGNQALTRSLPVARGVSEGDEITWNGYEIRVFDTPGMTDGSISYLLEVDGKHVCFCGDVLYGPGQIWDLYSLQKGYETHDYHGFMGARKLLQASLRKLGGCGADMLIPSHGQPIVAPKAATELVCERLDEAYRNYSSVSALHHYFPEIMQRQMKMEPLITPGQHEMPEWLERVAATSFAVKSESGACFVIDCGTTGVVDKLDEWIRAGRIRKVDFAWVTHYHDDHVNGLWEMVRRMSCPVVTDASLAEIVESPQRFFLPCISHVGVPVERRTRHGETWQWNEFKLTAYHFPGQTLYHSGLMIQGADCSVFVSGDSLSPTGLDDYCTGNRNFLGRGRGMQFCLELIQRIKPDLVINQHQEKAFSYTDEQIELMQKVLDKREKIFARLLPWKHPDFGTDPWWVRAYPYEQDVRWGGRFVLEVWFTNHGNDAASAGAGIMVQKELKVLVGRQEVMVAAGENACLRFCIEVLDTAAPGKVVIPIDIFWDNAYLGAVACAVVNIF